MNEQVFTDVFGSEIILVYEVRHAILAKHPEVAEFIDRLEDVLGAPDEIRQSIRDERAVLYYQYREEVLKGKWVVVVVKQLERNFISTIYATDRVKAGEVLWRK